MKREVSITLKYDDGILLQQFLWIVWVFTNIKSGISSQTINQLGNYDVLHHFYAEVDDDTNLSRTSKIG